MMIAFVLSMPSCNSWNGKWSGEDQLYALVRNSGRSKAAQNLAKRIVKTGSFYYNFGDGWTACVSAKMVTSAEARGIRKRTHGFCGYDWMVDSILRHETIQVLQRNET